MKHFLPTLMFVIATGYFWATLFMFIFLCVGIIRGDWLLILSGIFFVGLGVYGIYKKLQDPDDY